MSNRMTYAQVQQISLRSGLAWLAWNDRNGLWHEYLRCYSAACDEHGRIDADDVRALIWEQCGGGEHELVDGIDERRVDLQIELSEPPPEKPTFAYEDLEKLSLRQCLVWLAKHDGCGNWSEYLSQPIAVVEDAVTSTDCYDEIWNLCNGDYRADDPGDLFE